MKCCRATLAACALLAASVPCVAQVGNQAGSITVLVMDDQGRPISLSAFVSLTTAAEIGPTTEVLPGMRQVSPQMSGHEWVFTNLVPGAEYVVRVEAPGFVTARQYVDLPPIANASARIDFYLVPEDGAKRLAKPAGMAILAPRAQKEVQQGIKDLEANKIESAQKHLAKALKMAPGNPLVNYLVGESWLRAGQVDEATRYLANAISLDPKQPQALVALGRLRFEQGDLAKATDLLQRAVEATPQSWLAHWLLAAALLRQGDYQHARAQAEFALKYGNEQADAASVILGMALAKLDKRYKAIETLSDYLNRHPNDPRGEQIRGLITELRRPRPDAPVVTAPQAKQTQPRSGIRSLAANLTAEPVAAATTTPPLSANVPPKENWAPPDVDAEKPELISGATCQLPQILRQAAKHAEELVSDLEKFSATEDFQEVEISRDGGLRQPITQKFRYLVFIEHIRPHLISIDEMRTPDHAYRMVGEPLMSSGLTALALAFHPDLAGDFDWKCEGMGEWKGQPAWLIRFQQRADRPTSRLHGLVTPTGGYSVALKGLAWVAANGDQVLHLVTDLVNPLEQVRLEREHFAIDYGLVNFHTHPVALWLPESVDMYFRYRGRSYHQYSRFSNFELFWVGTVQKIGEPKENAPKP